MTEAEIINTIRMLRVTTVGLILLGATLKIRLTPPGFQGDNLI